MKNGQKSRGASRGFQSFMEITMGVLLLTAGWVMWENHSPSQALSLSSVQQPIAVNTRFSPVTVERINRHMQFTEKKEEIRSLAMQMENSDFNSNLEEKTKQTESSLRMPALSNPFESENAAARVYRDIESSNEQYDPPVLPQDRINAMLEQERWLNRYSEQQKKAFIQRLKENARDAGYDIEITSDLQVRKVRKITNYSGD